jgi:hypothetical protein
MHLDGVFIGLMVMKVMVTSHQCTRGMASVREASSTPGYALLFGLLSANENQPIN